MIAAGAVAAVVGFFRRPLGLVLAGAALVAGVWLGLSWYGAARFKAGQEAERMASAAAARAIEAQYRLREQAMQKEWDARYADSKKQKEVALAAAGDMAVESDRLRIAIDAANTRASEAARTAGRAGAASAAAWRILQECRAEYAALAERADRVTEQARPVFEWAATVTK